jgi:hypothetical protein
MSREIRIGATLGRTGRNAAPPFPKPCAPVRVLVGVRGKEGQFTPDPAIRTRASVIAHAGALRFLFVRKAGSCQPLVQALYPGPDTSCLHRVLPSAPLALPRTRAPGSNGHQVLSKTAKSAISTNRTNVATICIRHPIGDFSPAARPVAPFGLVGPKGWVILAAIQTYP